MGSHNPADQLRDAMKMRRATLASGGGATCASGGLSCIQGPARAASRFCPTRRAWTSIHGCSAGIGRRAHLGSVDSGRGESADHEAGKLQIRFKVLPNGRIMDGSLVLEGRSGDTALDRAAWGALTGSNYPPLPRIFMGPIWNCGPCLCTTSSRSRPTGTKCIQSSS